MQRTRREMTLNCGKMASGDVVSHPFCAHSARFGAQKVPFCASHKNIVVFDAGPIRRMTYGIFF
jgi:hypothetical protein